MVYRVGKCRDVLLSLSLNVCGHSGETTVNFYQWRDSEDLILCFNLPYPTIELALFYSTLLYSVTLLLHLHILIHILEFCD